MKALRKCNASPIFTPVSADYCTQQGRMPIAICFRNQHGRVLLAAAEACCRESSGQNCSITQIAKRRRSRGHLRARSAQRLSGMHAAAPLYLEAREVYSNPGANGRTRLRKSRNPIETGLSVCGRIRSKSVSLSKKYEFPLRFETKFAANK